MTGAKRLPGFSLMEMLIVITLFSVFMLVISETFASFTLLHRKIANRAVLSQDLRFVTELMVRAARNEPISYTTPPAAKDTQLVLDMPNGHTMVFKKSTAGDAACADLPTISCLLLSTDSGATWSPISGKHINIELFDVYVRPTQSPFVMVGGVYPNNIQPYATVNIRERYMANNVQEQQSLGVQTTVSSRIYQR